MLLLNKGGRPTNCGGLPVVPCGGATKTVGSDDVPLSPSAPELLVFGSVPASLKSKALSG